MAKKLTDVSLVMDKLYELRTRGPKSKAVPRKIEGYDEAIDDVLALLSAIWFPTTPEVVYSTCENCGRRIRSATAKRCSEKRMCAWRAERHWVEGVGWVKK